MHKFILIVFFFILMQACRKEKFFSGSTNLSISADTLWFDTIFTKEPGQKGPISVTQIFSIRNKEKSTVRVNIRLGGGKNSPFRFAIDGFQGPEINNLEILGNDSVYVFVQCSLEANNVLNPALVQDSLMFTNGTVTQKTILTAYGWDANYFRRTELPCGGEWADKTKPYFCVDGVLVRKGCTFTIREGVTIYNSPRSTFFVEGTLRILGTAAQPVRFTGNKARSDVQFFPSQWIGLQFLPGSTGNVIRHAQIHNAAIGIRTDSTIVNTPWNVELENTSIMHCGTACCVGVTAAIKATNCVFAEGGTYTFLGLLGGKYELNHCTFSNFLTQSFYGVRNDAQFSVTNTLRDEFGRIIDTKKLEYVLRNSIIEGLNEEEFFEDKEGSAGFSSIVIGNLIRSKEKLYSQSSNFNIYNLSPEFEDYSKYIFRLKGTSPCKNTGQLYSGIPTQDFLGNNRDANPDMGAFELQ